MIYIYKLEILLYHTLSPEIKEKVNKYQKNNNNYFMYFVEEPRFNYYCIKFDSQIKESHTDKIQNLFQRFQQDNSNYELFKDIIKYTFSYFNL
jgi:hypothetical protein